MASNDCRKRCRILPSGATWQCPAIQDVPWMLFWAHPRHVQKSIRKSAPKSSSKNVSKSMSGIASRTQPYRDAVDPLFGLEYCKALQTQLQGSAVELGFADFENLTVITFR